MAIYDKGWNLYKEIILVCKKVENKNNYMHRDVMDQNIQKLKNRWSYMKEVNIKKK